MLKISLLSSLIILVCSCKTEQDHSYAIKDFRKSLQPHLIKMVSTGIVTYDSTLRNTATDKDLIELSQSEHPLLRASAFREMHKRNSFNYFDILMSHLGDTASVATDGGEFGIWYRMVSDDILQEAIWKTQEEKNKTIEQVLTKHNYLRSAYIILEQLEAQEKYYSFIKDMATRPRRLSDNGYELDFDDIEYALYGLAKFKKQDDIEIIKNRMLKGVRELSDLSFRLMTKFPDTAYLGVLQSYHRKQFYKFSGNRPYGFSGLIADRAAPEDFIRALAIQKNNRSAKLLDTMLINLSMHTCMPDKENITNEVIMQIWKNPCSAYAALRKKIRPDAEKILRGRSIIQLDRSSSPIDTIERIIRWY